MNCEKISQCQLLHTLKKRLVIIQPWASLHIHHQLQLNCFRGEQKPARCLFCSKLERDLDILKVKCQGQNVKSTKLLRVFIVTADQAPAISDQ